MIVVDKKLVNVFEYIHDWSDNNECINVITGTTALLGQLTLLITHCIILYSICRIDPIIHHSPVLFNPHVCSDAPIQHCSLACVHSMCKQIKPIC